MNNLPEIPNLEAILSGALSESKTLDFKREVTVDTAEKLRAIVDDVVAFLNTDGGVIVVGIEEVKKGNPVLRPLTGDPDQIARKIQDTIVSNISPTPASLEVTTQPVEGGFILLILIGKNSLKPYCNKQTGRYLRRRGPKNEPVLPDALEALRLGQKHLVERVQALGDAEKKAIETNDQIVLDAPRLLISLLPFDALAPNIPTFSLKDGMFSKKGMALPHGGYKSFEASENGHVVDAVDFNGKIHAQFLVTHDWLLHSLICHPINYEDGPGRINWTATRANIFGHLSSLKEFMQRENFDGPFALSIEIRNLHSRKWGKTFFPRTDTIMIVRPKIIEGFDPSALDELVCSKLRESHIHY